MSERRTHAHRVQNIIHNPRVSFTVNHTTFAGTARVVDKSTDSKLAEEVSSLMNTKYGWSDGLIVELRMKYNAMKHGLNLFEIISQVKSIKFSRLFF
jgi:hypothetical protein